MNLELTKSANKLYLAISESENKTLKIDALTYLSGLCEKTVKKCLRELRQKGYIINPQRQGKITTYQLFH